VLLFCIEVCRNSTATCSPRNTVLLVLFTSAAVIRACYSSLLIFMPLKLTSLLSVSIIFTFQGARVLLTCFGKMVKYNSSEEFYVLLTVQHLGIIFVNNQLDAQIFFMYVYFYSLRVSGSRVPIIRRINCINTTSGICHCIDDRLVCRFG